MAGKIIALRVLAPLKSRLRNAWRQQPPAAGRAGLCGAVLALALLAGCAALVSRPEPPRVAMAALELKEAGVLEQHFQIRLRVENPNNFDLPIDGLSIQLQLNGEPFVSGLSNTPVTIPRYGTALVDIDAVSTLSKLIRQLKNLAATPDGTVRYRLTGKVHLARPAMELPLRHEGDIELPWLDDKNMR